MSRPIKKSAAALAWAALVLLAACDAKGPPPAPEIRPARTEENLAFRIDGRMIARRVDVGHVVRVGDVIAELDRQPQQDAVRSARAGLAAAQAALHEAANNMERQQVLVRQGWTTRVQYDATEKAYQSARAAVDATTAVLHTAEDHLAYSQLLADSAGAVTATGAVAGEVVRAGQTIVTIAQDGSTDAVFDVPASLMRQVSRETLIGIALTDDPTVRTTGRVREVAPQADPVTRSFRVKVGLAEQPAAMRLGATVTGQAHMLAINGIELPATALTTADTLPAVWVVDPKTRQVSLRPVELQRQGSSSIVVSAGLEGGELVVTAGVHALRPGQKVRVQEASS